MNSKRSHSWQVRVSYVLGWLLVLLVAAQAQETLSTILDTVKDATGAVVAGATVEVVNARINTDAMHTSERHAYCDTH